MKFSRSMTAPGLPIAAGKVGSSGEEHLTDAVKYGASNQVAFSDYCLDTESVVLEALAMLEGHRMSTARQF
jgi:hypothetical protein